MNKRYENEKVSLLKTKQRVEYIQAMHPL